MSFVIETNNVKTVVYISHISKVCAVVHKKTVQVSKYSFPISQVKNVSATSSLKLVHIDLFTEKQCATEIQSMKCQTAIEHFFDTWLNLLLIIDQSFDS